MTSKNLSLVKIGPESDFVLRNLCEFYMHDMAEWFDIDIQPDGRYSYDTSVVWEKGYDAYLAKAGDSIAGFALVGPVGEWLGGMGGHDIHEFFVIRRFRRIGLGQEMATRLWSAYPGEWLVRVLAANLPAVSFWRNTIAGYAGGSYAEEGRTSNGRDWIFFRFASRAVTP